MKIIVKRRAIGPELLKLLQVAERDGHKREARKLRRAYMEYEEEGEAVISIEEEGSPDDIRRLLSENIARIIDIIKREQLSISELADKLKRSVSNVYSDIMFLENKKFVVTFKRGRRRIPVLLLEEVRIIP